MEDEDVAAALSSSTGVMAEEVNDTMTSSSALPGPEFDWEYYKKCVVQLGNVTMPMLSDNETTESACIKITDFMTTQAVVFEPKEQVRIIVGYGIFILLGFIANLSVIWVIMRHSKARTARNLYIINLAISDLIVCTITMPLTVVRLVELPSWNYGDTACVISSLAEGVNLVVSSLTACAIATDRLFMVLRKTPGQNDEKIARICTIIFFIWVISVVAILPAVFCTGTYDIYFPYSDLPLYHLCMEQWPHPWVHTVYSFLLMMVQFGIPIMVIMFTHSKIISVVKNRTKGAIIRTDNDAASSAAAEAAVGNNVCAQTKAEERRAKVTMRRNKKTTQILLTIAAYFVLSWLPYHIYTIVMELAHKKVLPLDVTPDTELTLFVVLHLLAMSNVISNPVMYGYLNSNLTDFFRAMIPYSSRNVQQNNNVNNMDVSVNCATAMLTETLELNNQAASEEESPEERLDSKVSTESTKNGEAKTLVQ